MAHCAFCSVLMSVWKQRYSFPGRGCFWHIIWVVVFLLHCSMLYPKSTWYIGAVSLWLCFMRALKYYDSSTTIILLSNMFAVCGMDRGLVWMRSSDASVTFSSGIEHVSVVIYYSISKMMFLIYLSRWWEVVKFVYKGSLLTLGLCLFFTKFVCTANSVDHGWLVMIFCCNIWIYDIYKYMFNIFLDVTIFYPNPITSGFTLRLPQDLWDLLKQKNGKWTLWFITKNRDTKW